MSAEPVLIVPPIFVEFDDATLLAFSTVDEAEAGMYPEVVDSVKVWDASGTALAFAPIMQYRLRLSPTGDAGSERDLLSDVLRDHLRARNVSGVDGLAFDEMVYKASIRFVAAQPDNNVLPGLVGVFIRDLVFRSLLHP